MRRILLVIRWPSPRKVAQHYLVELREQGMSYAEIAAAVGVSERRVRERLTGGEDGLTFILITKESGWLQ